METETHFFSPKICVNGKESCISFSLLFHGPKWKLKHFFFSPKLSQKRDSNFSYKTSRQTHLRRLARVPAWCCCSFAPSRTDESSGTWWCSWPRFGREAEARSVWKTCRKEGNWVSKTESIYKVNRRIDGAKWAMEKMKVLSRADTKQTIREINILWHKLQCQWHKGKQQWMFDSLVRPLWISNHNLEISSNFNFSLFFVTINLQLWNSKPIVDVGDGNSQIHHKKENRRRRSS